MRVLTTTSDLSSDFKRCCEAYESLQMYSAWVGNPANHFPFIYLESLKKITALIGVSFLHSHPEGIRFLMDRNAKLRVVDDEGVYHPKVYIFSSKSGKAMILGSSNFTGSGFSKNTEVNILLEGPAYLDEIERLEKELANWNKNKNTIKPDEGWLKEYSAKYESERQKRKAARVKDGVEYEDALALSGASLMEMDWTGYIKVLRKEMQVHLAAHPGGTLDLKLKMLREIKETLLFPWTVETFETLTNRRMIIGSSDYGWLGHVGASGAFKQLIANGEPAIKKKLVAAINSIQKQQVPLNWKKLDSDLRSLTALGPTMKVWGRVLAIVRPDLFCTISSESVRTGLAGLTKKSKSHFTTIEGYLFLIRLIHSSPWFNSPEPDNLNEKEVWKNRVAFLDVILHKSKK